MAEPAAAGGPAGKMVIRNVGLMLSGDLKRPILDADTLIADKGRIVAFGKEKDLDTANAQVTIDAKGCALSPGLIDSHVHPVFGDWTPRQEPARLDRFLHEWRRHHHDLGGRGASARPARKTLSA